MQGNGQHLVGFVEGVLYAVTMVGIDIDIGDALALGDG